MAFPLEGGCDCGEVRYRTQTAPLFVHCCHCRWCQRETGASLVDTPSQSGMGQKIARCRRCRIALWSHYAGAGPILSFVRAGTLDQPDRLPPDIHIFTASQQPWVVIPCGIPAVPEYYERRREFLPQLEAYQAELKRKRS